jgi:hypothetical protein
MGAQAVARLNEEMVLVAAGWQEAERGGLLQRAGTTAQTLATTKSGT